MNDFLLKDVIKKSGLKKKAIAEKMGISAYTLAMKLDNKRKFNIDEVAELCNILAISTEKREAIFFNNNVENISTK